MTHCGVPCFPVSNPVETKRARLSGQLTLWVIITGAVVECFKLAAAAAAASDTNSASALPSSH